MRTIQHWVGGTLSDARGEVRRGLEVIEFACGTQHVEHPVAASYHFPTAS